MSLRKGFASQVEPLDANGTRGQQLPPIQVGNTRFV